MNNKGKIFLSVSKIATGITVTFIVYVLLGILLSYWLGKSVNSIIINSIAIITGALCGFFATHKFWEIKFLFGKTRKPHIVGVLVVVLSLGLTISCNTLFTYIPFDKLMPQITEYSAESYYTIPLWLSMVIYCGVTPLAEEIIFRVLLFRQMKNIWPMWVAIVVSALVFGLYHGNVQQGIYAFIMGAAMALVFGMTDNFIYTFLFHIVANALVNLAFFYENISKFMYSIPGMIVGIILTAVGVAGIVLYLKESKALAANKEGK